MDHPSLYKWTVSTDPTGTLSDFKTFNEQLGESDNPIGEEGRSNSGDNSVTPIVPYSTPPKKRYLHLFPLVRVSMMHPTMVLECLIRKEGIIGVNPYVYQQIEGRDFKNQSIVQSLGTTS